MFSSSISKCTDLCLLAKMGLLRTAILACSLCVAGVVAKRMRNRRRRSSAVQTDARAEQEASLKYPVAKNSAHLWCWVCREFCTSDLRNFIIQTRPGKCRVAAGTCNIDIVLCVGYSHSRVYSLYWDSIDLYWQRFSKWFTSWGWKFCNIWLCRADQFWESQICRVARWRAHSLARCKRKSIWK